MEVIGRVESGTETESDSGDKAEAIKFAFQAEQIYLDSHIRGNDDYL